MFHRITRITKIVTEEYFSKSPAEDQRKGINIYKQPNIVVKYRYFLKTKLTIKANVSSLYRILFKLIKIISFYKALNFLGFCRVIVFKIM